MNVIRFAGGLGNQMFQYALYDSFLQRNIEVLGDLSYYDRYQNEMPFVLKDVYKQVNIKWEDSSNLWKYQPFYEGDPSTYDDTIWNMKQRYLIGFWQTEKYFSWNKDRLLDTFLFQPKDARLLQLAKYLQDIPNITSVHIRRGDYLDKEYLYGNICTTAYYHRAITYIKNRVSSPQFIFFSDDIEWVKNIFMIKDAIYVEKEMFDNYQDWYDMFLITQCKHNIIANSSFSWWGAWLNRHSEKLVITPNRWLTPYETKDIWIDSWIRMAWS